MTDQYYIGAHWGKRKESADECADRLAKFLHGLAPIDDTFSHWFQSASTRRKALNRGVQISHSALRERLLAGRNRKDAGKAVIEELGFAVRLWSGQEDEEASVLSVHCGAHSSQPLSNSVVLYFPRSGAGAERCLQAGNVLRTMKFIAECWDPDWAVCVSRDLRSELEKYLGSPLRMPFPGWMLFLSRSRGEVPALPAPSSVAQIPGGSIIIAKEEIVGTGAHDVLLIRRIGEMLDRANLLTATR